MKLLVSACLLGLHCRYDGTAKPHPEIASLQARHTLIPVCPEQLGGLPTPREPSERRQDRVWSKCGRDVTAAYTRGAVETLRLAQLCGCTGAVLKERSPSCGCGAIYDGSFTGALVDGDGVTSSLLRANGIPVWGESMLGDLEAFAAAQAANDPDNSPSTEQETGPAND